MTPAQLDAIALDGIALLLQSRSWDDPSILPTIADVLVGRGRAIDAGQARAADGDRQGTCYNCGLPTDHGYSLQGVHGPPALVCPGCHDRIQEAREAIRRTL